MGTEPRPVILLIDDELSFAAAVAEYMSPWASVRYAPTLAEGFRLLQEQCPDILVVDQRLPDGNGLELLRWALTHCPESARVLITAYSEQAVIQEAINEVRIAYYIAKPIELPQLQLLLQQLWYSLLLQRSQKELRQQLQQYYRDLEARIAERTAQLQKAYEELQRLLEFRQQMVRFLLHDLKVPLSNLRLLWQELSQSLSQTEQYADTLALGEEILQQMEELLANISLAAALESPHFPLRRLRLELAELARRTVAHFAARARAKGITLTLTAPPSAASTILGDPTLLERLLANLLENALKYTPTGGTIQLRLIPDGDKLHLEVADTGIGMSPEDIAAALSGTGRPQGEPTAGESSTGLGLSIIRRIAQLHGAELHIHSPGKGQGTTFRLTFPRAETLEPVSPSPQAP